MLNQSQRNFVQSRQLHCRDVCKISLWSIKHILNQSTSNFGLIFYLIKIFLVGREDLFSESDFKIFWPESHQPVWKMEGWF